jgi:hypothetical protein
LQTNETEEEQWGSDWDYFTRVMWQNPPRT